jgi:hypothetical protein
MTTLPAGGAFDCSIPERAPPQPVAASNARDKTAHEGS